MPKALVIRAPGTNCDAEMCRGFELAGATPQLVHIDTLIAHPGTLDSADLIGFPGGFSYGDDIASGRVFAMKIRESLFSPLREAARRGVPIIGACNGFQVLVQVGLLPGPSEGWTASGSESPIQTAALADNVSGRFVDRWVGVATPPRSNCIWTQGLGTAWSEGDTPSPHLHDIMMLPVAHGEGRFQAASDSVLDTLDRNGQIALTYTDNFNGSARSIAGISDVSGRIFGLMPHPERFLDWTRHPYWTRLPAALRSKPTPGLLMFRNAVQAVVNAHA